MKPAGAPTPRWAAQAEALCSRTSTNGNEVTKAPPHSIANASLASATAPRGPRWIAPAEALCSRTSAEEGEVTQ
eukprot:16025227-Heterocapsa_arctica.AAC.1